MKRVILQVVLISALVIAIAVLGVVIYQQVRGIPSETNAPSLAAGTNQDVEQNDGPDVAIDQSPPISPTVPGEEPVTGEPEQSEAGTEEVSVSQPDDPSSAADEAATAPASDRPKPETAAQAAQSFPSLWFAIALALLSGATLLATAICFYLYYWRRILLTQPNTLVPEEWGRYLAQVGQTTKHLSTVVQSSSQETTRANTDNSQKISDMFDAFMKLQGALDERDAEIRRLKKGYDAQVYRKFLFRFIRVHRTLVELSEDSDTVKKELGLLQGLMEDALEECGIEPFVPPLDVDWRTVKGVSDNPKIIETDDESRDFKIAEVIEPGYLLRSGETEDIIVEARVRVFALKS